MASCDVFLIFSCIIARNCAQAKFNPGLCKWQFKPMRETCRVNLGDCYCDPYCRCFNDCCNDVEGNLRLYRSINYINCITIGYI